MGENRYEKMFTVSWGQLHKDTKTLAYRLADREYKGIIAITRGGLVPAAIIARELNIRVVDTICVVSYNWQTMDTKESKLLKGVEGDGEGWLVVDELVDTGRTAKFVKNLLPKADYVTVYVKPEGKPLVDMYITEVSQDTWILFPWDSDIQFTKPIKHTGEH